MMCIGGIDYSMTCPALCVFEGDTFSFDACRFYYITDKKKYQGDFMGGKITGIPMPKEYLCEAERYASLARIILDKLDEHGCMEVILEDYAMGAKGRVFHIGENTGILKYFLWADNIEVHTVEPMVLKKFATGKGNADKDKMYDTFFAQTNKQLLIEYDTQKVNNPISDIVDAYFLTKYRVEQKALCAGIDKVGLLSE
jgi:Holliday junction resolvasome RuvABC endonuclease subunit